MASACGDRTHAVEFKSEIRPLLEKYCLECHGAKETKGDVDLVPFNAEDELEKDQELWLDVLEQVRSYAMPPSKAQQPSEAERAMLHTWLEKAMDAIDARALRNPGRPPIHRLNRIEYDHTIRDLIGTDLRLADDFPADDIAYGFDNVADVLTLSPILLEKYLSAAESVLDQAIVSESAPALLEQKMEGEALNGVRPSEEKDAAELALEKEIGTTVDVPDAGEYEIKVRASQKGAGKEPTVLVLKVDGIDTKVWNINEEATSVQLQAVVPLGAGARRLSFRHTWHTSLTKEKQPPDVRVFVDNIEMSGPVKVAAHRRIFFSEPSTAVSERDCARQVIERFASRAFRRPVEPGELDRLLRLYDQGRASGKSHIEAARLSLLSILVSPQFLFRIERDESEKDEVGAFRLNDWELASRLSYFLWSSMPDDELLKLASEKRLNDPTILRQQVMRMLVDPKAEALVENFAGQWLSLRKFETVAPDPELFPAFKPALRQAMAAEVLLFFRTIMREDRSILEFLNADWTMVNEDLARHYRIPDVAGGYMRRVALSDPNRGGIMTMAAVLTSTSHPTRTSAVKRGKWVLEEILGTPPPPPPPNVPELDTPAKGAAPATTLRARLERHRDDPRCFGCHVRMDALGLGLENFDAIGRWREKEGDNKIDASGTLPDGKSFKSPAELKKVLMEHKEEFARNLVEKMFVYALGRGLQRYDRREVKRVTEALAQNEWRFSTLITEIASSYPFRYRKAPEAEAASAAVANTP